MVGEGGVELIADNECEAGEGQVSLHSTICPLGFFDDIQTRVDDELVHVLRSVGETEPGNAIAAAFGGTKCDVENRRIGW